MPQVILIHANCHNETALGDFAFAGNMAKDLVIELKKNPFNEIDIILVSTTDGVKRFKKLYEPIIDSTNVNVQGTAVGVQSLETFDAIENTVVAFIDAHRCKHSAADIVKRVLSPESKLLFVGNANFPSLSNPLIKIAYTKQLRSEQPGLYDFFSGEHIFISNAGFGADRLGLPTITKLEDLPPLTASQKSMLPATDYGFMYLALDSPQDYQLIAQYIKLSGEERFVLVGQFGGHSMAINSAITSVTKKQPPHIQYYQSLPNTVMRQMVANTSGSLVASTGITSTLEAMRDQKLTYYQNMSNNAEFVTTYLLAVKSIVSSETALFGAMPQLIIELANLLFAEKPLSLRDSERTRDLITMSSIRSRLITTNQTIVAQASGTLAPRLLSFFQSTPSAPGANQLTAVCHSLCKPGEKDNPVLDQALRRAASLGKLFELKVLIKSLPPWDLDKEDATYKRSALHWAVIKKQSPCACLLVKAGATLNKQDIEGQTPLHKATINGDAVLCRLFLAKGASATIQDSSNKTPKDYATTPEMLLIFQSDTANRVKEVKTPHKRIQFFSGYDPQLLGTNILQVYKRYTRQS